MNEYTLITVIDKNVCLGLSFWRCNVYADIRTNRRQLTGVVESGRFSLPLISRHIFRTFRN